MSRDRGAEDATLNHVLTVNGVRSPGFYTRQKGMDQGYFAAKGGNSVDVHKVQVSGREMLVGRWVDGKRVRL